MTTGSLYTSCEASREKLVRMVAIFETFSISLTRAQALAQSILERCSVCLLR